MKKVEFMRELTSLLSDLPTEEKREALQYYQDYFEDAGSENETKVTEELVSPRAVADKIKEGLSLGKESAFSEDVKPNQERYSSNNRSDRYNGGDSNQNNNTLKIVLIVLAVILLSPAIGGAIGLIVGLIAAVIGIFVAIIAGAFGILISGVTLFVSGVAGLVVDAPLGIAMMGTGLVLLALGAAATVGAAFITVKASVVIYKWMSDIWTKLFYKRRFA